jgi:hypothetical protein
MLWKLRNWRVTVYLLRSQPILIRALASRRLTLAALLRHAGTVALKTWIATLDHVLSSHADARKSLAFPRYFVDPRAAGRMPQGSPCRSAPLTQIDQITISSSFVCDRRVGKPAMTSGRGRNSPGANLPDRRIGLDPDVTRGWYDRFGEALCDGPYFEQALVANGAKKAAGSQ